MSEPLVSELLRMLSAPPAENRRASIFAPDALAPEEADGVLRLLGHDLKSPGGDVVSALSLLHEIPDTQGGPVGKQMVASALGAARHQLALIDELLKLLALERGILKPDIEALDAAELLGEALADVQDAIAHKAVEVAPRVPPGWPPVEANRELLRQVMRALLYNTLKFCVRGDMLTISAHEVGPFGVLAFVDTGRAVYPEFAGTLFEMTAQWRARQAGSRTSVGIGLPFCRLALRAMGGRIMAQSSEDGARTAFVVALRRAGTAR